MENKIIEYFRLTDNEITIPHLEAYLIMKYSEKELIGGRLLEEIETYIKDGLMINTVGTKIKLTEKGETIVKGK